MMNLRLFTVPSLALSLAFLGACSEDSPDPSVTTPLEAPEGGEPTLSVDTPSVGGQAGSVSGIRPADVLVPGQGSDQGSASTPPPSSGGTPSAAGSPELPPGLDLPGISGLLDNENLVLESVTVSPALPGEGPVGPDGKVIDPATFLAEQEAALQGSEGLEPEADDAPGEVDSPGGATQPLDPSEAPPIPVSPSSGGGSDR